MVRENICAALVGPVLRLPAESDYLARLRMAQGMAALRVLQDNKPISIFRPERKPREVVVMHFQSEVSLSRCLGLLLIHNLHQSNGITSQTRYWVTTEHVKPNSPL